MVRESNGNVGSRQVPKKVESGRVPEIWDQGEYLMSPKTH